MDISGPAIEDARLPGVVRVCGITHGIMYLDNRLSLQKGELVVNISNAPFCNRVRRGLRVLLKLLNYRMRF